MRVRSFTLLALAACKGTVDPMAGTPNLVWSDDVLEFGEVEVGGEPAEELLELRNDGGGEIDLLTAILAEGDPDLWAVEWERTALGPGDAIDIRVLFTPEEPGLRVAGLVQIRTDLEVRPSLTIQVVGQGAPSTIDADGDGFTTAQGDCDDDDDERYPGATERCNGRDDDCDGAAGPTETDADGDGQRACGADCDDTRATVYDDAPEICDGLDSDCDGVIQDDLDPDGDGVTVCEGDCAPANPDAFPGATEVCGDAADNDCNGTVDVIDADGDGHDVCVAFGDCDDTNPLAFPRFVATTGAAGATGSASAPLASLAEALSTVDAVCRTIYVEPGTYAVSGLTWAAGEVAVIGRGTSAADVIFDAGGAGRHLDLTGGALELRAVTLTGGVAPAGQGGGSVRVGASAELVAVAAVFDGNSSDAEGGALRVDGTLALASGGTFTGNSATHGGALAVMSTGSALDPGLSAYVGNSATGAGGAIWAEGPLIVTGATLQANTAGEGGGLVWSAGGGHTVQRCQLWSNTATGPGGAAWLGAGSSGTFRNNWIQDNAAGDGAGVWVAGGATVANNTLAANVGTGEGAAVRVVGDAATVTANLAHFHDGLSSIFADLGSTSVVTHNTAFATSSGTDLGGALTVDVNENRSENPAFVAFSDNSDPTDDDLSLQPSSPAIDSGPAGQLDPDGTPNDRGATGGPGAL
jgi:hypothetical protein